MGLESVNYISDLDPTWPAGEDKIRFGDNHIRNIKKALKNTLPNVNGPVTVSDETLNLLPVDFNAFINALKAHLLPTGGIIAWGGSLGDIPSGWVLCDGQNGTPDLRSKFIIGAGGDFAVGASGGAAGGTASTSVSSDHTHAIAETVLTTAQIPSHAHTTATFTGSSSDNGDPGGLIITAGVQSNGTQTSPSFATGNAGGGLGHTHSEGPAGSHSHTVNLNPPYYALCFIKKTSVYTYAQS